MLASLNDLFEVLPDLGMDKRGKTKVSLIV